MLDLMEMDLGKVMEMDWVKVRGMVMGMGLERVMEMDWVMDLEQVLGWVKGMEMDMHQVVTRLHCSKRMK